MPNEFSLAMHKIQVDNKSLKTFHCQSLKRIMFSSINTVYYILWLSHILDVSSSTGHQTCIHCRSAWNPSLPRARELPLLVHILDGDWISESLTNDAIDFFQDCFPPLPSRLSIRQSSIHSHGRHQQITIKINTKREESSGHFLLWMHAFPTQKNFTESKPFRSPPLELFSRTYDLTALHRKLCVPVRPLLLPPGVCESLKQVKNACFFDGK